MTQGNHSCCHEVHGHVGDGEEYDPCMAKEIAAMERDRVLYGKLKEQSDRMLMSLNIRMDKARPRASVVQAEHSDGDTNSSGDEAISSGKYEIFHLLPSGFQQFISDKRGERVFSLIRPCDFAEARESFIKEFTETVAKLSRSEDGLVFVVFDLPVCVCGHCDEQGKKLSGSLRSLTMLLGKTPSIVITRNGGMLGMWTPSDGPLSDFVNRHSHR